MSIILDTTKENGFRYQLRKVANRFVIFSLDTRGIASYAEWSEEMIFNNEEKAIATFKKLFL